MKTGKSANKSGAKNTIQKSQKPGMQDVVSPVSKKMPRTIFSGQNTQLIKRNSIRSVQIKDKDKQKDRYKQLEKQRIKQQEKYSKKQQIAKKEKRDSGQSNKRKKVIEPKEPQQQNVLNFGSVPLYITLNDHRQIQESNIVNNFVDNNASCISVQSRPDCAIRQQQWQLDTKLIGFGSKSEVYKAFNIYTARIAAVKKIKITQDSSDREVKILSQLKHPNIVEYYGYTLDKDVISIYMEFIPTNLRQIYSNFGGVIPYENIRMYTKQLVSAVHCIHNQKIIHKDIKCENILLNQKGIIKLSDFGQSKQFNQSTSLSANRAAGSTFSLRGSIRWIAPESLNGEYTRRSDVWSLGCTVLEMATGKIPWAQFQHQNFITDMILMSKSQQPPLIPNQLPQDLKDFLNLCLVLDVQKRKTTSELLNSPFLTKK